MEICPVCSKGKLRKGKVREEMFGVEVPEGAVYSHQSRRRREVAFDAELRGETERVVAAIREMQLSGALPAPVNDSRCPRCHFGGGGGGSPGRSLRGCWRMLCPRCGSQILAADGQQSTQPLHLTLG